MSGAPNCQNPVWSPEAKAIISAAWDIREAWDNYWRYFVNSCSLITIKPVYCRSYKAIVSEWYRQHPLLHSCPNSPLERELGIALDELEAAL